MKDFLCNRLYTACVVMSGVTASLCLVAAALGQSASPQARITEAVQSDKIVTLRGNVHPMARPANDRGLLADQQPITKIHVLLQRSAAQETALQQLMAQQLDPGSPKFHAWLTPQQFGEQFGPADSDVQAVKDWLRSQGFAGLKVNNGKTLIEFDGTAGQVRNAFHSEVHRLSVRGEEHFANMQEPQIPAALASVVGGVVGLHNFRPKPFIHRLGRFQRNASTGAVTPLFTFTDVNGTFYGVGPKDFATIYNVPTAFDGTGQTIAIVAQTNINLQDVRDFRTIFGLPANDPQIILNGADPGLVSGDEGESDLDVQWAGAVAPGAKIIMVATPFTDTDGSGGVDSSAEYIVDNNLAGVLSESYGSCESGLGTAGNAFYSSLWQQGAAQGITVVVAAGDNGSAGCSDPNSESWSGQDATLTPGLAVSGIASTPYNVAMGGTDFNQSGLETKYWSSTNKPGEVSAQGYIPEMVWNDSCAATGSAGCSSVTSASPPKCPSCIVAGSGGPSSIYSKPSWQASTITGMPNDGKRDLPDVSLFSADGVTKSFYITCESDQDIPGDTGCNLSKFSSESGGPFHDFQAIGGTSAAAPAFAGIVALINQKTGQRQGNANVTLYALALAKAATFPSCDSGNTTAPTTCIFHDITGSKSSDGNTPNLNISVPCSGGSANCGKTSTGGFAVITSGGNPAFTVGVGYDLATGLGSVNVTNLLNNWTAATSTGTATSITLSPAAITGTAGLVSGNLTGTVTGSGGTPTGVVIFENATTNAPLASTTLSGGAYSLAAAMLPEGSYTLTARYGGDGTFGPKVSNSITVNLIKQASKVIVSFVAFTSNGAVSAIGTGAQSVQYGSNYTLRVDVENATDRCENISAGTLSFVCPTGTVSLLDNGKPLNDFPNAQTPNATNVANLNDRGFIEDQPIQLAVGSHPITATYTAAATSSYTSQASSNTLSVTITQATTTTAVTPNISSTTSGGSVTLTAVVSSGSNSTQGPTGTVQFMNGSSNLGTAAATCTPAGATSAAGASCTAKLTTAISSLPPGIIDVRPRTTPFVFLAWLAAVLATLSFMLAAKLAARRKQYAYAGLAFFLMAAAASAGCGGGSSSSGGGSSRSITAKYSGDTNYGGSTGSTTITVH
jgi:subtilase family serine protease